MGALVSVIIPVYNLEDYIENCIESIQNQTYSNFEVICVDDGSTDLSSDKIKSMAEKDDRIKYIYQPNSGVSTARNTGLDHACGDYVVFVDGDDYIHFQMLEILVACSIKNNCDMVCSFDFVTGSQHSKMERIKEYTCKPVSNKELFSDFQGSIRGKSVWAKMFKTDIAKSARFPTGISNGEDAYYIITLLSKHISVEAVDIRLYYYYCRENSAVTSKYNKSKFTITKSFDQICENLKGTDNEFLINYSLQYLFQSIFYNRTSCIGTSLESEVSSECKHFGKKWLKEFMSSKGIPLIIRISFLIFYYSRPIYELARMIKDPTMRDFYKNRRKQIPKG